MPLPELQPINPFAGFLQGRQARRQEGVAEQQNALMQLQLSEAQRKAQQEQGLNALYQGAVGPAGELDYTKLISGAAQQGYGSQIPGLVKQRAETESAQRAAEKDKIAATLKRIEVGAQLMSGVTDQASYDAARQQAAQVLGPEFAQQWPAVYNPQEIEANRLKAMSIKDQLDQHWKQMGYDLDAEKFSYQQQNDAANRGVTLRGQNMADARAKETQGKGQYDPTRGVIVDPRTGEARPVTMAGGGALPSRQQESRPLPAGTVEKLTADAEKADQITGLKGTFKDRYAGNVVGGSVENIAGRLGFGDQDQAEWWQQYDRLKNQVRNELFGATLTPSEEAAFLEADISPNMAPQIVKKNLAKQEEVIRAGLKRKAKVWETQGYNARAVVEATAPAGDGFKYLGFE